MNTRAARLQEVAGTECVTQEAPLLPEPRSATAEQPRQRHDHAEQRHQEHRYDECHPDRDDDARPGLEHAGLRVAPSPRQHPEQGGLDPVEQVGHAGEVGEHVVAVEPHQGRQLLEHLQELGRDEQQQCIRAGRPPRTGDRDGDERVEVEATQIRAEPTAATESVGVGDVGVERRPHQVDAGTHHPRRRAAVPGSGGVPELVEARREHGEREHGEKQAGTLERVVRRPSQPLPEQHPPAHRGEGRQQREGHHRSEEPHERRSQSSGLLRVGDGDAKSEAEQRVGPLGLGVTAVGAGEQAERSQLLGHQRSHVVRADALAGLFRDDGRHRRLVAGAVDGLEQGVQERCQLHHLPVATPREGRRDPVAGSRHLPDQLDAFGALERTLLRGGRGGGFYAGLTPEICHRYCWMSDCWSASAVASPSMLWLMIASC